MSISIKLTRYHLQQRLTVNTCPSNVSVIPKHMTNAQKLPDAKFKLHVQRMEYFRRQVFMPAHACSIDTCIKNATV